MLFLGKLTQFSALLVACACGGAVQNDNPRGDAGAGRDASSVEAALPPEASGADAKAEGASVPDSNACGACLPLDIGNGDVLASCCSPGALPNTCGLVVVAPYGDGQCVLRNQEGVPDDSCPPVAILGLAFPGCCRPDGKCGAFIDLGSEGSMGCVAPGQLGQPETFHCEYAPAGAE